MCTGGCRSSTSAGRAWKTRLGVSTAQGRAQAGPPFTGRDTAAGGWARTSSSLWEAFGASSQLVRGTEPVHFRRSLRTAPGLPQCVSPFSDIFVVEERDAVSIHTVPVHLRGMLVSKFGAFESLPGMLLPGSVILLLMSFRGATMCVGGAVVQFGSWLVILVM